MIHENNLLKKVYNLPSYENLKELISYFETIRGKNLKILFIRHKIFKTSWKGSEIRAISKCHIEAAIIYLKHLASIKEESDFTKEIRIVIAEIIPFLKQIDNEQDTSFILGSCNTLPSFVHYTNAQELFYNHNIREDYRTNYNCDLLVLYALRLTLEKRIFSIIGIDHITNNDNRPIPLSKMIKIVKSLKEIEFSSTINWIEIEATNKWLNHFMHRNLRPHPWTIHQIFKTIDNLISNKPFKNKNTISYSWYSDTVVKNIAAFEKEIKEILENEFPNSNVIWLNKSEVLIIK
jgi:hypothetical protein